MSGRFFFQSGFSEATIAPAATVVSVTPTDVQWITQDGLAIVGRGSGLGTTSGLVGTFTSIVARDASGNLVFDISGIQLDFADAANGFTIGQLLGGNDTLEASAAPDSFSGGAGFDYVSYVHAAGGVIINLGNNTSGNTAAGDSYRSIEGVLGSRFGDAITGDQNANNLFGGGGDDAIFALGGNDFVKGEAGADTLNGGAGDDTLDGGADADTIVGGAGFDYASYVDSATNVTVNLGSNQNGGGAAGDVLSEIEGVLGSRFGDAITGDQNANNLFGGGGDDAIFALGGNDFVKGEAGADTLNGGAGDDTLDGGADADTIVGGDGNDWIVYDATDNAANVTGGTGSDTLWILGGSAPTGFNLAAQGFEGARHDITDTTNQSWSSISDTYNAAWQRLTSDIRFDDGTRQIRNFDHLNNQTYSEFINQQLDMVNANTITKQFIAFDSGTKQERFFDYLGNQTYVEYINDYADAARPDSITRQVIFFDNGTKQERFFDYLNNQPAYSEYVNFYNAAGQITRQVGFNDAGAKAWEYFY